MRELITIDTAEENRLITELQKRGDFEALRMKKVFKHAGSISNTR